MDILSVLGLIIGVGSIIGGNLLEGGHIDSLIQLAAFVIVFGGTIGAVMLQTPLKTFVRSMRISVWVFFTPSTAGLEQIEKMVNWSNIARKEGLLGLEALAEMEENELSRKGLMLLIDGTEPDNIRSMLEIDISSTEHRDTQAAKVFEGLGGYSPTIGIIGAVLGLIHVMNNLADPSKLGPGIAVAFVATIYGVALANLLFLPMASKLKAVVHSQAQFQEMIMEGIISIAEGENPRNIETKLLSYID
ncbi:MAG: flagellar motor protein [Gammaproteobacteria bacterium]|nr:flagellar motor protein [Gammaproteobacteria bacterium]